MLIVLEEREGERALWRGCPLRILSEIGGETSATLGAADERLDCAGRESLLVQSALAKARAEETELVLFVVDGEV
jgi:hypothetical protein